MGEPGDIDCTLFVGNLNEKVTEELLFELFLQAGPIKNVCIPKDRATGKQRNYGFVTFKHKVSVKYSIDLLNGIRMFEKSLSLNVKHKAKNFADEPGNRSEDMSYHSNSRSDMRVSGHHRNGEVNSSPYALGFHPQSLPAMHLHPAAVQVDPRMMSPFNHSYEREGRSPSRKHSFHGQHSFESEQHSHHQKRPAREAHAHIRHRTSGVGSNHVNDFRERTLHKEHRRSHRHAKSHHFHKS